jgi:hypothetical protein
LSTRRRLAIFSEVNAGVKLPGILTPGIYNGMKVGLLPFFSGGLASTDDSAAQAWCKTSSMVGARRR